MGATSGQLGKSFHGLLLAKKNANSVQVNNNMGTDKAPSLFLNKECGVVVGTVVTTIKELTTIDWYRCFYASLPAGRDELQQLLVR